MKKYPSPVWMVSLVIAAFFFSACSKIRNEINEHGFDVGKFCRIEALDVDMDGTGKLTHIQFTYNAAGDPLEVRVTNAQYGIDNHFRYDKKGRLSDMLFTDPGGTFVYIWHRYIYPSPRVIIDSIYTYQGNVNDPNPPYDQPGRRTVIQLDEQGRIGSYDHNGNLIQSGVKYDDKINIYRTSRVWQFLYQDYSRNNLTAGGGTTGLPVTPAAYNAFGLPTKFLWPFGGIFSFYTFRTMDVTYSCDVPAGPHSY